MQGAGLPGLPGLAVLVQVAHGLVEAGGQVTAAHQVAQLLQRVCTVINGWKI